MNSPFKMSDELETNSPFQYPDHEHTAANEDNWLNEEAMDANEMEAPDDSAFETYEIDGFLNDSEEASEVENESANFSSVPMLVYRVSQQNELETKTDEGPIRNWYLSLPLIICGPILRKVHYNNVSLWLAFKEAVTDIKLEVFEASGGKIILSGTSKNPVKIGEHIFITVVAAAGTSAKLKAGVIYGYRVSFIHDGILKNLDTPGILKNGIVSISYKPYTFPTFCIPADSLTNLKIVHGSCRKPHGGKTDALRALDTMIEVNSNNSQERPQLLCLTGDQIYADDVSDTLLRKIKVAERYLVGWKETLPKKYEPVQLLPGNRKDIIAKSGNKTGDIKKITADDLTTTDAKSHLIYLSEFILMYMFAFSEVLWSDDMPFIAEPDSPDKATLDSFYKSLPFVRKALANISTLMIFDDHDVTDDWFISKEWSQVALLKGTLSRRYILNGLLAYAIFQDWGNDPSKYSSGNGKNILMALQANNKDGYPNKFTYKLESLLLPLVEKESKTASYYLKSNFKWHYRIDYNSFLLVVLNTRTERQYYDSEKPLGNLVKNVGTQFGQFNCAKQLVIVSAAPVFGNMNMEIAQEKAREGHMDKLTGIASRVKDFTGMFEKDQEAWSFSNKGFSSLLLRLSMFDKVLILSGDVHYGFTSHIKLWRKSGSSYHLSNIVQSVSSALKNSTQQTHYPVTDVDWHGIAGNLVVSSSKEYKMVKVIKKQPIKHGAKFDIANPRFENVDDTLMFGTQLRMPEFSIDAFLQFSVRYIKSNDFNPADQLFQKIRRSMQSGFFTDKGFYKKTHNTVVGKDNISLISFTDNSVISSIFYASGPWDKPEEKESARLLFPFAKHRIDFSKQFKEEDLPVFKLKRYISVNQELEYA